METAAHSMETAAEVTLEAVLCAVVAHAGATLRARDVASAAGVSRACRAAVGPHGVVRAALGSQYYWERRKGCERVVARVRAGEGEDEGEAASGAALLKRTFDALLEALLRDGDGEVRREAVRALWALSGGGVAPERAKAMVEALGGEALALFELEGHGDQVHSVCFSPDGKMVASGSADEVRLWNAETGACVKTLEGHDGWVCSVCFSPDGLLLASGGDDNVVRLWDVETGACVRTLAGHGDQVESVCFSPDGRVVASGSWDRTVRLWDAGTGACIRTLEGHGRAVISVCFSPDGNQVASGSSDDTVRLWDVETGACVKTLEGHGRGVKSVCFSPDGKKVASGVAQSGSDDDTQSGSDDDTVRLYIWDLETGERVKTLGGHTWRGVTSVCISPDGKWVASGSEDLTEAPGLLWDAETGACVSELWGHDGGVNSVCFSPDGRMVASASDDREVWLWLVVLE